MRQIWKGVQKSKYDNHSVTAATTDVAVSQAASGIWGYWCNCPDWTANSKGAVVVKRK